MLLVGVVVCAVGFVVTSILVVHGVTDRFDHAVLLSLQASRTPGWNQFFLAFTDLGAQEVTYTATAGIAGALLLARRRVPAVALAVAVSGGSLLVQGMKSLLARPRPPEALHMYLTSGYAFPSGHTINAFAFYVTVALLSAELVRDRAVRRFLVGYALAVGAAVAFSRLYLGVHYPTDVLGGALCGTGWALTVIAGQRFASRGDQ